MPTTFASRAVLRQSRNLLRRHNIRHASTTAETASKAKETAQGTASKAKESAQAGVSKASEGLSRVQSSASSATARTTEAAKSAASSVTGRIEGVVSFVNSLIPPAIYYSRVGWELSRIVFQGQKMAPPSLSQFQSYFQPLTNAVRNPSKIMSTASSTASSAAAQPETILNTARNVNRQQLASIGIIAAEILGFFTVGTMIGRLKIVGYHGEVHHEH